MHTTLTTFAFAILTSAMVCPAPAQANTSAPSQHETEFDKRDDQHLQLVGSLTMLNVSSSQKSLLPDPAVVAKIDLSEQRMRVYLNGLELHSWKVSTARRGYYTPRGNFTPYRMHTMWRSRKYHNAPMPYSVFFHKGWAIHGTNAISRLGRPASHGCVRLHPSNARAFFELIKASGGMHAAKVIITK